MRSTQELAHGVVLMDISTPECAGIAAAARIRDLKLPGAVLPLTAHDRDEYLFRSLPAGALGYVLKKDEVAEARPL